MRTQPARGRPVGRMVATLALTTLAACVLVAPAVAQINVEVPVLHLDGVVDPFVADYVEGGIERAQSDGDPAVMIEIDTPGGLDSSMRQITQAILNAQLPVICYVAPQGARAASAGAFVLTSCPIAAMAPGTNVGAATPVGLDGAVGSDKAVNDAAAYIRSLAERYGRDADLAESYVRDATSITAEAALDAGMIDAIAPTPQELLTQLDGQSFELGDGSSVTLDTGMWVFTDEAMGGLVGLIHNLLDPTLAFIFFWLGLALIILELLVPGHVFSGTVGTFLLIVAIASFGVLPVQAIGILLLIAAAVLMVIELNAPGFGVWGFAGLACLVLGGWFLYDRAGGVAVSPLAIAIVAAGVGLFFALVVTKVMRMRHMPPAQGAESVIGREGVAIAGGLHPDGVVRVASEEWRAITSDGRPIAGGTPVRVTKLEGLVLTVDAITGEREPAGIAPTEEGRNT
ncbi:MAG TPA: nodulation protein NfeD [Actinomycetota bacterium]